MIPVILAGGSGTRFWPLSRKSRPKQLLSLFGDDDRTMIEATVDRLRPLCTDDRPLSIVCRPELVDPTRRAVGDESHIEFIEEPAARNTAPAIAYATATLEARYGDEPLAFFPADHFVCGQKAFERQLRFAVQRARRGPIVTLGIAPTRPETGYGYIELADVVDDIDGDPDAYPVEAFVEKPDHNRAVEYLQSGRHLWNSGIFAFRPSTLWREFQSQRPAMSTILEQLRDALAEPEVTPPDVVSIFEQLESISIDYAVLEGAEDVEVVPVTFRWSDVGHWAALHEVFSTDEHDNIVDADEVLLDGVTDSVIVARGDQRRLIAAADISQMIVVDTDDALLLIPRHKAQKVRQLVAALRDGEFDDLR